MNTEQDPSTTQDGNEEIETEKRKQSIFKCDICDKVFSYKNNLHRHKQYIPELVIPA